MDSHSSTRPTKRKRVDNPELSATTSTSDSKSWSADPDVWFDDGNIIIVAGPVAFRVYKGTLARSSEVFQHLLALPTPESDQEVNGVPVVHLTDSHVDLKHIFLALFLNKNFYYHEGERSTPDFSVLFALIKLGDKYNIASVMQEALACVKRYYAPTLTEWRKVKHRATYVKTCPEDAMAVVRIARITGQSKLLAPSFLICTSLGSTLMEKLGQPDGLSSDDVMRVMDGKVALSRRCNAHDLLLRGWTHNSYFKCLTDCRARLRRLLLKPFFVDFVDALAQEDIKNWETKVKDVDLCKLCRKSFDTEVEWHCKRIWNYLPAAFGLTAAPEELPARRPPRVGERDSTSDSSFTDSSDLSDSSDSDESSSDSD